jgi:hypothetical protein
MSGAPDLMRTWLELGRSRSPRRDVRGSAVTAPKARDGVEALQYGTRRALGIATVVAGGVALTHQPLADALAASHGAGVPGAAHAVLLWPAPLVQPVLAGLGAFALLIIGMNSHGWRQITPRQRWCLLAFTAAAILGAAPMALLCVLAVVVIALAIMVGLLIFFAVLILLIAGRRR